MSAPCYFRLLAGVWRRQSRRREDLLHYVSGGAPALVLIVMIHLDGCWHQPLGHVPTYPRMRIRLPCPDSKDGD